MENNSPSNTQSVAITRWNPTINPCMKYKITPNGHVWNHWSVSCFLSFTVAVFPFQQCIQLTHLNKQTQVSIYYICTYTFCTTINSGLSFVSVVSFSDTMVSWSDFVSKFPRKLFNFSWVTVLPCVYFCFCFHSFSFCRSPALSLPLCQPPVTHITASALLSLPCPPHSFAPHSHAAHSV